MKEDKRGGDSFLAGQKTWWIRPLTGIKTRSEEPGFGNRRGRRDKPKVVEMMCSVWSLEI